ncbi:MAG: DUF169 domain-containing protein [Chloroflexota bacterium]|nr:DUF169 domain-containing protein [Chloroflexota bacterium]
MTSTPYADLATRLLTGLDLDYPPVAVARVDAAPSGIAAWTEAVPSACTFWRRAEQQVFFADEAAHMGCPIGAMVMGFELPEAKQEELMSLVGDMCSLAYIREEEIPHIPHFDPGPRGAVYGPLATFPLEPDNVILWLTPKQTMYLEESLGGTLWTGPQEGVFGRPACGVLPTAAARDAASVSLGCIGMRTFTEIPDAYVLAAVPGAALATLADGLDSTIAVNGTMEAQYQEMKSAV